MAPIRVYTKPTCGHCTAAKQWLDEHGWKFEELDITSDVEVLREWRSISGGVGVPVFAHGKDIMIGFNPERLAQFVDAADHVSA